MDYYGGWFVANNVAPYSRLFVFIVVWKPSDVTHCSSHLQDPAQTHQVMMELAHQRDDFIYE